MNRKFAAVVFILVGSLVGSSNANDDMDTDCNGLSAKVSPISSSKVLLRIQNNTTRDIYWENYFWDTKAGLVSDILVVSSRDGRAEFLGIQVDRLRPKPQDYILLSSGGAYELEIDVSAFYRFPPPARDISVAAEFFLFYLFDKNDASSEKQRCFCELRSAAVKLER